MGNGNGGYFSGRLGLGTDEEVETMRAELHQYRDAMSRIQKMPTPRAVVVNVTEKSVLLAAGSGSILEVPMPLAPWAKRLRPGSVVKVVSETMAPFEIVENPESVGEIVTVRASGKDGHCEVDHAGKIRLVRHGFSEAPEPGDRVVVDSTGSVAVVSLGKDDSRFSFSGETGVGWDDIGGLEKAKEDLKEAIELPFRHPGLYAAYGKKPARGVMLYGPPGCGKTMLGKAVATAVREIHGESAAATGFVYVKGPELLDKFVGTSEANIRSLFARTRQHYKAHRYPAVLFVDEADALLGKRGARLNMGMETTIVPQFLSEMDGLDESGCVVLLSTNRPDTIDPAVTREGRVDIKVRVSRPGKKDVEDIIRLAMRGRPTEGPLERIVSAGAGALFSPQNVLYEVVLKDRKVEKFTLESLVSGSMVATVVERASTIALREDLKRGRDASGVSARHVEDAVQAIFQQNMHTNHDEALEDFCERFQDQVKEIRRPKAESLIVSLI